MTEERQMSVWNWICKEYGQRTGEGPAKAAEAIAKFYDIRLELLRRDPTMVARFDAQALARAEKREQMGS